MKLPPPIHGATLINQSIKDSDYINRLFHLDIVSLHFTDLKNMGRFGVYKVCKMIKYYFIIFYKLLSNNYHAVYFTLSPVGIAFFRDIFYVLIFKLFRKDIIYHLHGKGIKQRMQSREIYSMLYNFVFNNTNVIHLSYILFDDLKYISVPYKKFVIENGIRDDSFKIDIPKNNAIPNLLYLSNLEKTKGILDLIEACNLLYDSGQKFKLNIVGGFVKSIPIEKFNKILENKQNYINYLGPKYGDEKIDILKKTDIFVFPTYYPNECFPLVILEAMQFGIPVISTKEGAIPEIIDNDKTGFIVEKNSPDQIAEKLEVLIKNSDLRNKMGKAGRKKFIENYTIDKFEENLVGIMDDVLCC